MAKTFVYVEPKEPETAKPGGEGGGEEMRVSRFALSLLIVVAAMATLFAQTPAQAGDDRARRRDLGDDRQRRRRTTPPNRPCSRACRRSSRSRALADAYHYDPQGRRDPFQSLIGPAPKLQPGSVRRACRDS